MLSEHKENAKILNRDRLIEIFKEPNTAIDKIISEHYAALDRLDEQFNAVVEVCSQLSDAAAGTDQYEINKWLDKYGTEDFKVNWRKILEERKLI